MKRIWMLVFLGVLCLGLLLYSFLLPPVTEPGAGTETSRTTEGATEPAQTPTEPSVEPTEPSQETQPATLLRIGCADQAQSEEWGSLCREFAEEAGVEVELVSAADPQAVLVIHEDAVAAIEGCEQWMDLYDTAAYAQLASWDMALRHDGKVCAIPTQVRCVGLLCNTQLLAACGYSLSEIDSLQKLQLVVDQLAAVGAKAFAAPDMELLTLVAASAAPQSRQFVDLYMANSLSQTEAGDRSGISQMHEGQAVFWLGEAGDYEALSQTAPGILPVYLGLDNEQSQTLCTVGGGFLSIRKDAQEDQIQAARAFLDYLVLPRQTGAVPLDTVSVMAPFRQTTYCTNVLEQRLRDELTAGKSCLVCIQPELLPVGARQALEAYVLEPGDVLWDRFTSALGQ